MDLDTARQLLQDFELILGIAQQGTATGLATIREFTESPDFAPEAPSTLAVEDLTNQHLFSPLPKITVNNFPKIKVNNFPTIGLHLLFLTRSELVALVTRTPHALWHPGLLISSTGTDAVTEAEVETPQPWIEEEIDLLRSLRTNTKAKHVWFVIATIPHG